MKKEMERKKEIAKILFLQGETLKSIADKVNVSQVTLCKWAKTLAWKEERGAKKITRKELVLKLLERIDKKLENDNWSADEMIKATSAIEKLDKQTNVVTIIDVFTGFDNWLVSRMKLDTMLTPGLVKTINRYHDLYINENLRNVRLSFE